MTRINLWLLGIFLVLLVPTVWTLREDRTVFVDASEAEQLLAGFTAENIWAVRIERPQLDAAGVARRDAEGRVLRDAVNLERYDVDDESRWRLGGRDEALAGLPVAYDRVVQEVLEPLAAIVVESDTLVRSGADAAALEQFALTEEQALLVRCADPQGTEVATLLIGRDASRGQVGEDVVRGYFVRKAESTDVVLFERPVWLLSANRDAWIETNPIGLTNQEVVGVSLSNPLTRIEEDLPNGRLVVKRDSAEDANWQAVEAPPRQDRVRNAEVYGFLQTLGRFSVQNYVARLPETAEPRMQALADHGLDEPRVRLELTLQDGSVRTLLVGKPVMRDGQLQNESYVLVSGTPFIVSVNNSSVALLERSPLGWLEPRRAR